MKINEENYKSVTSTLYSEKGIPYLNDAVKQGVWKFWDEKGKLVKEQVYENDELITEKKFE